MIEPELQRFVLQVADAYRGWLRYHTHNARRSAKGFPDWAFTRARPRPRLLLVELKGDTAYGRRGPTDEQLRWLDALTAVAAVAPDAVEVYVWTPADRQLIERVLAPGYRS